LLLLFENQALIFWRPYKLDSLGNILNFCDEVLVIFIIAVTLRFSLPNLCWASFLHFSTFCSFQPNAT